MIGDSELLQHRGSLKTLTKQIIIPQILKRFSAFLSVGDRNEEYYRQYGVADTAIFRVTFKLMKPPTLRRVTIARRCASQFGTNIGLARMISSPSLLASFRRVNAQGICLMHSHCFKAKLIAGSAHFSPEMVRTWQNLQKRPKKIACLRIWQGLLMLIVCPHYMQPLTCLFILLALIPIL